MKVTLTIIAFSLMIGCQMSSRIDEPRNDNFNDSLNGDTVSNSKFGAMDSVFTSNDGALVNTTK